MATGTVRLLELYGYWSCMATGVIWLLEQYGYWSKFLKIKKKIALNHLGRPQRRN
jgi:hypothetical protein